MSNFQQREYAQRTYTTEYTGAPTIGVGVDATDYASGSSVVHSSNNEFVFGFEARAEAAYQVTKNFGIRGGIDVIDFAQGIWRGANPGFGNINNQDQDVPASRFHTRT
ncbi:MAG: hypothetical protein R3C53_04765 [Pirellulaceae bacterium]